MLALMNSRAAISRLVECPATSRTICSSCRMPLPRAPPGPRRRACSPVARSSARERAVRSWSLASRRRLLLRSAGRRCGPRSPAPIQWAWRGCVRPATPARPRRPLRPRSWPPPRRAPRPPRGPWPQRGSRCRVSGRGGRRRSRAPAARPSAGWRRSSPPRSAGAGTTDAGAVARPDQEPTSPAAARGPDQPGTGLVMAAISGAGRRPGRSLIWCRMIPWHGGLLGGFAGLPGSSCG